MLTFFFLFVEIKLTCIYTSLTEVKWTKMSFFYISSVYVFLFYMYCVYCFISFCNITFIFCGGETHLSWGKYEKEWVQHGPMERMCIIFLALGEVCVIVLYFLFFSFFSKDCMVINTAILCVYVWWNGVVIYIFRMIPITKAIVDSFVPFIYTFGIDNMPVVVATSYILSFPK